MLHHLGVEYLLLVNDMVIDVCVCVCVRVCVSLSVRLWMRGQVRRIT